MPTTIKIVTNETPKQRFLTSGQNIQSHREMIDSSEFQRAVDFAIMEYHQALALDSAKDINRAGANALKSAGAHEFIAVLRNLSERPEPIAAPVPIAQLNHRA